MNTPNVLARGTLAETPFLDVIVDAWGRDEPTTVEIVRDAGRRSFWFRDGALVALTSSSRSESFAAMLVKRKKLQVSVASSIHQKKAREGITPSQVILRDRILPVPDLVRELSLWATLLLVESFGWTDADWRICEDPPGAEPPETLLELNLIRALRKGVFKRLSPDDARAMLRPYHDKNPRRTQPAPRSIVSYDLDAHEHTFWEALGGGRTLGDIRDYTTIPPDSAARLLYLLHRTGMLTFAGRSTHAAAAEPGLDSVWGAPSSPDVSSGELELDPDDLTTETEIPAVGGTGVDMSQIFFHRGASTGDEAKSKTFHAVSPHSRESFSSAGSSAWKKVSVGVGHADEVTASDEPVPGRDPGLSSLFSDVGFGEQAPADPPEPGSRQPLRAAPADGVPAGGDQPNPNAPPGGKGPVIEQEAWNRLSTKDKDRIRIMRKELNRMAVTNYFEWFGVSPQSPVGSIKKAYFQMAKLYHPDSLLDESDVYRSLAELLFTKFSEAYEVLSDDGTREKYLSKEIRGEPDENDLAMMKVQKILSAENAFKKGLRALDRGRLKEALRHFKEAVKGYEEEAEYVAYYGFVLFRSRLAGDPTGAKEGIDLMKQATKMKPNAPKPFHLLGKAHLQLAEPKSAKAYLRKALKLQPDAPDVQRDYRRANELEKTGERSGGAIPSGAPPSSKKSLFGTLFGKKKSESKSGGDDDGGLDF
jgi:tetratricopeptide (TPR) repeat protein